MFVDLTDSPLSIQSILTIIESFLQSSIVSQSSTVYRANTAVLLSTQTLTRAPAYIHKWFFWSSSTNLSWFMFPTPLRHPPHSVCPSSYHSVPCSTLTRNITLIKFESSNSFYYDQCHSLCHRLHAYSPHTIDKLQAPTHCRLARARAPWITAQNIGFLSITKF